MTNPKLKVELDLFDKIIEKLGKGLVLILLALPFYYYSELPEIIPTHFDIYGKPDGFANKSVIAFLPILGIILFEGMSFLGRHPEMLNLPIEITEENASYLYKVAVRFIIILKTLVALLLCYISYASIQTALGNQNGLNSRVMGIIILAIFLSTIFFLIKSSRIKS